MRTSPARISRRRSGPAGITLMELLLVLGLLAMLMLLAVPTFQNLVQGPLDREVNHLSGLIRLLRNEAVLGNRKFRLVFDLERGGYSVEQEDEFGQYAPREEPRMLRPHEFPSVFMLQDAVVFGATFRPDDKKPVPVHIDPSGTIDPFMIHFKIEDVGYTLKVSGFTGKVEMLNGYVDR